MYIHPKPFILSTECFTTCHRLLSNIIWIFRGHSPECLAISPGIFGDIPQNVWRHFPEYLATFPRIFGDIPRNVWPHYPKCLRTFPGMFGHIPRNITFPLFLAFPAFRSPFLYSRFYTDFYNLYCTRFSFLQITSSLLRN